jgi:transcriptional regulator with XRE-family HTH domain
VTTSVAKVVGANARSLRLAAHRTLEDMAQAAGQCGLSSWTTGRVGDFEAGRVVPNLDVIYAAATALGQVIGRPVTLAELLATDEPVQINDKLSVGPAALRGEVVAITGGFVGHGGLSADAKPVPTEIYVRNTFREADERMCRSLGVDRDTGAAAMARLWGCTFAAERDLRARDLRTDPDFNPQRLGQVSRKLKADLKAELRKTTDGHH